MSADLTALLEVASADLDDDTPRLVLADWFEARGERPRAEFVRVQCALEPVRDKYEIANAVALHERENALLRAHQSDWLEGLPIGHEHRQLGIHAAFRRGFVDTLSMPADTFLSLGHALRRKLPTLRRVVLYRVAGRGQALAGCEALAGLAELELACWYRDADAKAIAASLHLGKLRVLELWLGRRKPLRDRRLCEIMANLARDRPALRQIVLLEPDGTSKLGLVALTNTAAERPVAVHRRGYPERFPFAPDIGYDLFPGRLPDGRAALARQEDTETQLTVITFDDDGEQTEDVLTVPMPNNLPEYSYEPAYRERLLRQLERAIGFLPAFIRVRTCRFPWDSHGYTVPDCGHEDDWEQLGQPDLDTPDHHEQHGPEGIGGKAVWLVKGGQYVIHWEHWADKRGRIHST